MPRAILHAHRDGWESALNHPGAVVIDYPAQTFRQGTTRFEVKGRRVFAFLAFMLRGADLTHARRAIAQAVFDDPERWAQPITTLIAYAAPALTWLGMTIETRYAAGLILHTEPRESLPWTDQPARSQPLPTHVRLPAGGAKGSLRAPTRLPRVSGGSAWKHTHPQPASSENSKR